MNAIFHPMFVGKLNYQCRIMITTNSGYQSTKRNLQFSKNLNSFMLEKMKKHESNMEMEIDSALDDSFPFFLEIRVTSQSQRDTQSFRLTCKYTELSSKKYSLSVCLLYLQKFKQ